MDMASPFKSNWKRVGGIAAVLAGVVSAGFVASLGGTIWTMLPAAILAGVLFAGVFGALFLVKAAYDLSRMQHERLLTRVDQVETELRAVVNIRPVTGPLPLEMSGWAMHAVLGETIAREIALNQPRLVLECGSGSSTAFIAYCLSQFCPDGRVVSLDHEAEYADKTRRLLQKVGMTGRAEVVTAPLHTCQVNGQEVEWYGFEPASLGEQRIDLLVVDGPPGNHARRARYPAVPILREYLADEAVVIMDDGNRSDEKEIARLWSEELGGGLQYVKSSKGVWVIRRRKVSSFSEEAVVLPSPMAPSLPTDS